jgi:hypothetical protein
MTRAEGIRAGLAEPVELLRSKSGSWHLFNERLDEKLARTECHPVPRIVMVGKLATVTGLDIAYWRPPLPQIGHGGKTCCECNWIEAAFGTAWPLVIAECVQRALEGIRNDDLPGLAEEVGSARGDRQASPTGTHEHLPQDAHPALGSRPLRARDSWPRQLPRRNLVPGRGLKLLRQGP